MVRFRKEKCRKHTDSGLYPAYGSLLGCLTGRHSSEAGKTILRTAGFCQEGMPGIRHISLYEVLLATELNLNKNQEICLGWAELLFRLLFTKFEFLRPWNPMNSSKKAGISLHQGKKKKAGHAADSIWIAATATDIGGSFAHTGN